MWSQVACHNSDEMSAGLSLWKVIRFGQHGRIRRKCNKDSGFVDAKSGEALQMFLMMTFLSGKFSGTWLTTAQRVAIWATDRHRERRFTVSSSFSKGRMFRCSSASIFNLWMFATSLSASSFWLISTSILLDGVSGSLFKSLLVFEGVLVPTSLRVRRFRGVSK